MKKALYGMAALVAAGTVSGGGLAQGSLAEQGRAVFERECAVCHSPGTPSTALLEKKYEGRVPALLEERDDLTPELVKSTVRSFGARMPASRPTEVTDAELEALADYLSKPDAE